MPMSYKTQKMKVKLTVQVISAFCAKALEYLRTSGYADFSDDILSVSQDDDDVFVTSGCSVITEHSYCNSLPRITPYVENMTTYIAGFVILKLLSKLKRAECRELLVGVADAQCCSFLQLKNNAGLVRPRCTASATKPRYLLSSAGFIE